MQLQLSNQTSIELIHSEKILPKNSTNRSFDIRIGINTGSVVAGVVGETKFAYDIWGDAVNTASRMEKLGEVNTINISEATYHLVKDNFSFHDKSVNVFREELAKFGCVFKF